MRFGSVCSGIEAASVAWEPLGWKAAWFSEIEPFPSAVLAHHYPDTPNYGDMTTLPDRILAGEVEAPDLFCGGTPCQAFSVAGLRQSLADARGNLSLTFVEIADAIDHVRRAGGKPPAIVFWENVPGVLNTADNAFGCFLGALAGCDTAIDPLAATGWTDAGVVAGPRRTVAWRVLDAQFFGLAQRRRRVFVCAVGNSRKGFDPAAVLLEFDGVRRDSAPSREAGQRVAPTIAGCANGGGANGPGRDVDSVESLQVARCVTTGEGSRLDGESCTFITHSLRGEGFDASEDGTGRGTSLAPVPMINMQGSKGNAVAQADGPSFTLNAMHGHDMHAVAVPVAVPDVAGTMKACKDSGGWSNSADHAAAGYMLPVGVFQDSEYGVQQYDSAGTLRAGRIPEHQMVMQPVAAGAHAPVHAFDDRQSGVIQYGDKTGPLDTDGHSVGVLAFSSKDHGGDATADLAPTLRAMNHADSHANGGGQMAVAMRESGQGYWMQDEIAGTIDANMGMSGHANRPAVIKQLAMQVRRLTPVECERLQGFPDGYTAIPWRNKPADECPDGPRYKALGNSWAVPVVRWIGRRIQSGADA